ncbi:MAG: T9SS type A sorting domain-containing protein [Flavobacteriales bacterium]|nr:T9SS type A sorting domain-containing protein [Flavobacteriales bacterium]
MMHRYLCVLLLSIGLLADRTAAEAQTVFIPDPYTRTWLNIAKPNSVDANGDCDTAAWNAAPPSAVGFDLSSVPNGGAVDLEGIQHLKIGTLEIRDGDINNATVALQGFPLNLGQIRLIDIPSSNISGLLPLPPLSIFWCDNCDMATLPAFTGGYLWFWNNDLSAQVQSVPMDVVDLRMNSCNISNVPPLPVGLLRLEISDNPLSAWPSVPAGLLELEASRVGLNYAPANLPNGLTHLGVDGNDIPTLPPLPTSLTGLSANNNLLTSIPPLPMFMQALYVSNNPLDSLPVLPFFMSQLSAGSCGLSALPAWSPNLTNVHLDSNAFTSFPPLPGSLGLLNLRGCAGLTCLPPLPAGMSNVWVGGTGITCLPNIPPGLNLNPFALGIQPVVCNPGTSPCPIVDPLIIGTTFVDADVDGVFDAGEAARPNATVIAQPGDLLTASDINGNYVLPANVGSFSVTGVPGLYEPVTTAPYAVTFTGVGQVDSLNHIGFNVIPGMYDLVTTITGTNVRPGFNTGVWVNVHNVGTEPTTATVQLTFDAALSYVSSSEVPDAVNGNVVDWTTPSIVPGGSWTVWVELYGPPALVLGTPVVQQATATPSQPDQTPADNTYILNDVVVGSFDPNDKKVEPSTLSLLDIASGTRVVYTVRFQNTGTFPAERVLITDTLSSDLQWATMQVLGSSHTHTWYIHNGVLHVLFENINLPDSVSDEPGSHGFVKFSFVPSNTLITGDDVGNIANIFFDYNDPVITNEALFYVETSLAVDGADTDGLRAWPNPAQDVLFVALAGATIGTLSVVDATGREVLTSTATSTRAVLNIGALAAGPYLLRCTNSKGVRTTHLMKH